MPATIQKILKPTKYRAVDTAPNNLYSSNLANDFENVSFDNFSFVNGVLTLEATGSDVENVAITNPVDVAVGDEFLVSFTISSGGGSGVYFKLAPDSNLNSADFTTDALANGTHSFTMSSSSLTDSTSYFGFRSNDAHNGTLVITDISIQKIGNNGNNHGQIYSGRALEFDGAVDYLTGPTVAEGFTDLSYTKNFTVACWLKIDSLEDAGVWAMGQSTDDRVGLTIGADGEIAFSAWDSSSYTHASGGAEGSKAIEANTWYRVICTMSPTNTKKLYINGVLQTGTSQTFGSPLSSISTQLYIGRTGLSATGYLGMKMSDFQVWNSTWTQDDVTFDYLNPESLALNNSGTSLTESNLKLWYPMQDGHRGQKSYVLDGANTGLGDELIVNGDYSDTTSTDSSVSALAGWDNAGTHSGAGQRVTISNGQATIVSDGTDIRLQQTILTSGVTYKYSVDIISNDGAGGTAMRFEMGSGTTIASFSTVGTHTGYFTADNTSFRVRRTGACNVTFDNVSIKPVNDKHHATTEFLGDDLFDANKGTFTNGSNELRITPETEISSNSLNDNTWYEISAQNSVDFTAVGAPNNNVGTVFCLTTESASAPTMTSNDKVYEIDLSWTTVGGGKMYLDSNALVITSGSSTTSPGQVRLSDAADLKEDLVVGRTYKVDFEIKMSSGNGKLKIINGAGVTTNGTTTSSTSFVEDSITFVAGHATDAKISASGIETGETVIIDNITIKEVGVASGWTDADQQLDIPQTALQSYNQLGFSYGAEHSAGGSINCGAITSGAWTTLDIWFFPQTSGYTQGLLDQVSWSGDDEDSSTGGYGFRVTINATDKIVLTRRVSGTSASDTMTSTNTINIGKWNHVAVVIPKNDGTSMRMMLNGYYEQTNSSGDHGNTSKDFRLGYGGGIDYDSMLGCIAQASYFKEHMSETQMLELYNEGTPIDSRNHSIGTDNLAGYWRNNGVNGNTWTNLANPGTNDGTPGTLITETMLIPAGVDASRDTQGFIMNRQKNTNALNLCTNLLASGIGDGPHAKVKHIDLGTSDFSICFWAYKIRDWTDQYIVSQFVDDNNRWYIRGNNSTSAVLNIYAKSTDIDSGTDYIILSDNDTVDLDTNHLDKWLHVACTVDRSDTSAGIQWYLNGAASSNKGVNSGEGQEDASLSLAADVTIGWNEQSGQADHHFDGMIDDLLIYNDKLEATEVKRIYNAGKRSHRND